MPRGKGDIAIVARPPKAAVSNMISDYINSGLMGSDFAELEPRDRLLIAEKLMQYVMPKMQSVAVGADDQKPMTIEAKLIELSKVPETQ